MLARVMVLAMFVLLMTPSCREEDGDGGGPGEDMAYYCDQFARHWCPAYRECEEANFNNNFRSYDECIEQTEQDCLDPPREVPSCRGGVTPEETDACVDYIESNFPEGCWNLFGHSADMSPCEQEICDSFN